MQRYLFSSATSSCATKTIGGGGDLSCPQVSAYACVSTYSCFYVCACAGVCVFDTV